MHSGNLTKLESPYSANHIHKTTKHVSNHYYYGEVCRGIYQCYGRGDFMWYMGCNFMSIQIYEDGTFGQNAENNISFQTA